MIIAVTGHRPEDCEDESIVRDKLRTNIIDSGADVLICGMASGVDLWAADEAIRENISVLAAKPWTTHGPRTADEELYRFVEENAIAVKVVTEADDYPGPWVYHKRNEWMVDNATHVLAYWSGKKSGGAYACINYAKKKGVPVRNVY